MADYKLYETLKRAWIKNHPNASPEEYAAAMREIAKVCGF